MKKTICLLLVCVMLVMCLAACGGKEDGSVEATESVFVADDREVGEDFMEKYVADLDDGARGRFFAFWTTMDKYCEGIERALSDAKNTQSYEFNPMDVGSVPTEIADLYFFDDLSVALGAKDHTDYNLVIENGKVTLSFDGHVFYPNDYTTSKIKSIVDKYAE